MAGDPGVGSRIIPAYAGSTGSLTAYRGRRRDHPRIRGEHEIYRDLVLEVQRIIPAYAGSTRIFFEAYLGDWDHPRIRGEHVTSWGGPESGCGSSPHTRGAPAVFLDRAHSRGIIPAYAGSTVSVFA